MRLALFVIVLFPALALAQDKAKDEDKVSNDNRIVRSRCRRPRPR